MKKIIYTYLVVAGVALIGLAGSAFAVVQQELGFAKITANTLPSDGCDHTVRIGRTTYALDAVSHERVAKAFEKIEYGTSVRQWIWYSKTGNTGTVQCGWGATQQYSEIHIDFFVPKK